MAFQVQGRSCSSVRAGWSLMRARTSASHVSGSMSFNLAVMISVATRAARSAPRSEPANSHDLRPSAKPLSARSAALFERQIRPSSRKRVKAGCHAVKATALLFGSHCENGLVEPRYFAPV